MNTVIKIALGILLASFIIFIGRLIFLGVFLNAATEGIKNITQTPVRIVQHKQSPYSANYQKHTSPFKHQENRIKKNNLVDKIVDSYYGSTQYKEEQYNNETISFKYQLNNIDTRSVCKHIVNNLSSYSKCTVTAKNYFINTCKALQTIKNVSANHKFNRVKNMFCNAGTSYQPTIAQIKMSETKDTPLQKQKDKCNGLIIEAMINDSPTLQKERDVACNKYSSLDRSGSN